MEDAPLDAVEPSSSAAGRPSEVRLAALIACVTATLGLLIPTWAALQRLMAPSSVQTPWWVGLSLGLLILVSALSPVFYFAVYRHGANLRISRGLQRLCFGAALVLAMLVAYRVPRWIESFKPTSVLSERRSPWTLGDASTLLGLCADLGAVALLVALYRQEDSDAPAEPAARLLRTTTGLAVVAFGITTAATAVRLLLTPYAYGQLRAVMLQSGRTPPPLSRFVTEGMLAVLVQACSLAAPLAVWFAMRKGKRAEAAPPAGEAVDAAGSEPPQEP